MSTPATRRPSANTDERGASRSRQRTRLKEAEVIGLVECGIERLLPVPTPATDLAEPEDGELDDEDEPNAPAREEPTAPETIEVSAARRSKRACAA